MIYLNYLYHLVDMEAKNSSNVINIEKYIEENIEKKINQLFDILPQNITVNTPKMIHEYTISELYTGTIQTVIDIINDLTLLNSDIKYISTQNYRERLFKIFLKDDRKIFLGILLIILSFILYFIDGSDV